jgi:hypothetical protein
VDVRFAEEGAIMRHLGPYLALMALVLAVGVNGLVHFSENLFHASDNVRTVDVVGLSGGGAACGAAVFGVIFALVRGRRPTEDKQPPDKPPPPP